MSPVDSGYFPSFRPLFSALLAHFRDLPPFNRVRGLDQFSPMCGNGLLRTEQGSTIAGQARLFPRRATAPGFEAQTLWEAPGAFWEHNTGTIARVLDSGDVGPLADDPTHSA